MTVCTDGKRLYAAIEKAAAALVANSDTAVRAGYEVHLELTQADCRTSPVLRVEVYRPLGAKTFKAE